MSTIVCVLFVATATSTVCVYYFRMCTVCGHSYELRVHMYCLWPLLFMCLTIVLVYIVYYSYYFSELYLPASVLYNSVSVYYFYYYILKLYLPPPGGEESPWMTASHWTQKQIFSIFFSAPFIYSRTSCGNRAQLVTAWSTGDTCTVCGHPTMSNYFTMYFYKIEGVAVLAFTYCSGYHCYSYYLSDYKLGVHMYCLWPPHYYKLGVHGVAV